MKFSDLDKPRSWYNPESFIPRGVEARVCEDIARRQEMGIKKYGTTVEELEVPLRDWLQHQYEELLDAAIYCKKAMELMDKHKL